MEPQLTPYDLVIIGAGYTGRRIAQNLSDKRLKTALIALPGNPEDYYRGMLSAIHGTMAPLSETSGAVLTGACRFLSPTSIFVGNQTLIAKKFVIAAGCVPFLPAIDGLKDVAWQTPAQALLYKPVPNSAVVLGGGHIGQAVVNHLVENGCAVTWMDEREKVLGDMEPEFVSALMKPIEEGRVRINNSTKILSVSSENKTIIKVRYQAGGSMNEIAVDALILATGVTPNTDGLDADKAGVYVEKNKRIVVNDEMRTSNPRIWAVGEVTGAPYGMALADFQADIVAHNVTAPFFDKKRLTPDLFPHYIPTIPTVVRLGMSEQEAKLRHKDAVAVTHEWPGHIIKIIARQRSGTLLGVHILGRSAGELILLFDLMLRAEITVHDVFERHHYLSQTAAEDIFAAMEMWIKKAE